MIESTKIFRVTESGDLISSNDYTSYETEALLTVSRFIHRGETPLLGMTSGIFYALENVSLEEIRLHLAATASEDVPTNQRPEFKEIKMMVRVKYENETELRKLWRC
jgi:hypothetical protein